MTPVQVSPALPTTLHHWELTLTRALLRADGGNTDAIRSFEITPETLAAYCGLGPEYAGTAEAAFKAALRADRHLVWCLQHGAYRLPGTDQPNCIAILALSLLVDSLLDGVYENKGQYRAKLSEWLSIDKSFTDLRGIASMWRTLEAWLDGRATIGAPFRRLILPEIPASWTHIGYTRYLSFPTKRDIRLLVKQIGRNPKASVDAAALVLQLDPIVRTSEASHGLKAAFEDFKTALRSGAASVDHRFWRLVTRAREQVGHVAPAPGSLVMEFDEDGYRSYRVGGAGDKMTKLALLGSAVASVAIADSVNLGPSIRRGALLFRSSGLANWNAIGELPPGNGPFHLAIANRHLPLVGSAILDFVASGGWSVTAQPIPTGTVSDALRRIGFTNAKQTVRTIGLVDGIRVGSGWLGQPRYLPYLEGASRDVEVAAVDGGEPGRLVWRNGDLRADSPVDGQFSIADTSAHWSRRASFVSLAEVHSGFDAVAYSLPAQAEWRLTSTQRCSRTDALSVEWDNARYANQDMIEALYASSRAGQAEGDAIAVIGRAAKSQCWDMLRSLQEASFFDARPRERWRGRVFTLGRPTLTKIRIGETSAVVVSGAIATRLETDLRTTAALQGGAAFRRVSEDSLAPPLLGAIGVDIDALSIALGWPVVDPPIQPDGAVASRLIETKVRDDAYQASSWWDWSLGRFRIGAVPGGPVSLTRLVHPGGLDHDIYRVEGRTVRSFHSRQAAILDAYAQAGLPLFRYEQGYVTRLAVEGALPLELAAALRVRSLSNGGGTIGGWRYRVTKHDAVWLARLLPGVIDGVRDDAGNDAAMSYRRGRSARRPLWSEGRVAE